jgi:hypothetical protein
VNLEWKPREWDGEFQYTDVETETLVMLPTDMALIEDAEFRPYAELYARDQDAFFEDFSSAYARLMSLGCPQECDPTREEEKTEATDSASAEFREFAMHGSVEYMKRIADRADVHALEARSNRSALHKAAFWGHEEAVEYLVNDCKLDVNVQDYNGDTALHDAARFGHEKIAKVLLGAGADPSLLNAAGQDVVALAKAYKKRAVVELVQHQATTKPMPAV